MPIVRAGDIDIHYEMRGSGPLLLLVAGTGYPGATWPASFVEPLAESVTVLTYDHRGTGASSATDGPYSTRMFAADAANLIGTLGFRDAHVLGHSMGGRVAQWMALDAPASIRSLVLAASGPGQYREDRPLTRGIPLITAEQMIDLGYQHYMAIHIEETFFTAEFASEHPEVVSALFESFWDHRPSLRDYLKHIVARQRHQTAERLEDIAAPTLVLVGDHDTGVRGTGSHLEQSEYLARHLSNATLEALSNTSHGYIWQTPERTAHVVADWIAAREAGS